LLGLAYCLPYYVCYQTYVTAFTIGLNMVFFRNHILL
jgi:hypothetical protein